MNIAELIASLKAPQPQDDLEPELKALWWARKGDWEAAHRLVQETDTREANLIHAYLHRAEGDESNAHHWYRRADADFPAVSLEEEWCVIAGQLLLHVH